MQFQILFVKEHNFQVSDLMKKFPDLNRDRLFEEARRRVIAIL